MKKLVLTLALLSLATVTTAQETEITGFVDAAYFKDVAAKNGEFTLDQVEVDIVHWASDKTLVRADLEWVRDGDVHTAQLEQGFMTYTADCGGSLTFGKFNAPIGFELLDPPDMFQYSHSLVFDHGLPTNLTGLMLSKEFDGGMDLALHVSNGWDADAMAGKNVTWGGRLGYGSGGFTGGISAISGKEEVAETDPIEAFTRTVFDVDLGYATGRWQFGGEYNQGKVTDQMDVESEWTGFMLMANVAYNEWGGFTFRFDNFDDSDGSVFDLVGGEAQAIRSLTFCPTFVLDENFGCLVEYRLFTSDQDGFVDKDGEATDTSSFLAFEMTYSW